MKAGLPRQTHHMQPHNVHGSSYQALFDLLSLGGKCQEKCKTNTYIFMISSTLLSCSIAAISVVMLVCACVCLYWKSGVSFASTVIPSVTAGVGVLWLLTWFVLVERTVVHGWSAVQHARVKDSFVFLLYYNTSQAGKRRCRKLFFFSSFLVDMITS